MSGHGISEEIKYKILQRIAAKGKATWSDIVSHVAKEVGVHPMYVERAMGTLVQAKKLERHEGKGFPTYSLLASASPPGRIDGKYDDYNQKRLEDSVNPSKSGSYEDDPRKKTINGPDAV